MCVRYVVKKAVSERITPELCASGGEVKIEFRPEDFIRPPKGALLISGFNSPRDEYVKALVDVAYGGTHCQLCPIQCEQRIQEFDHEVFWKLIAEAKKHLNK